MSDLESKTGQQIAKELLRTPRAFPATIKFRNPNGDMGEVSSYGLTKREYFAAMAMQGMLANPDNSCSFDAATGGGEIAKDALGYADAMLSALEGEAEG